MVIVLFRSRLSDEAAEDYASTATAMEAHARAMPGFVGFKSFRAEDGERLSVIHWESEDTLRAWAEDERHRAAQRLGREKWYRYFQIEVAEVIRAYGFERP